MFASVVLLSGPAERTILAERLKALRPDLEVIAAISRDELRAISTKTLAQSRLIAFVTPVIVPPEILKALGYGAYNFHPGSPEYPGATPAQFAVYQRAEQFGATVHKMVATVDAGQIVAAATFPLPPHASVEAVETLAYTHLARLFWELTPALVAPAPLAETDIAWGTTRSTRRTTAEMCDMPADIDRAELDRRIAAFARNPFGIAPTLVLHGHRFRLEAAGA